MLVISVAIIIFYLLAVIRVLNVVILGLAIGQDARLQLLWGGERVREHPRQRVGQDQAVSGDANRRVDMAERIFDDDPVMLAAKDQPDAGIVARLAVAVIQGREIE